MSMRIKQAVNEVKETLTLPHGLAPGGQDLHTQKKKRSKYQQFNPLNSPDTGLSQACSILLLLERLMHSLKVNSQQPPPVPGTWFIKWETTKHLRKSSEVFGSVLPTLNASKLLRAYKFWNHGVFTPDTKTIEVS